MATPTTTKAPNFIEVLATVTVSKNFGAEPFVAAYSLTLMVIVQSLLAGIVLQLFDQSRYDFLCSKLTPRCPQGPQACIVGDKTLWLNDNSYYFVFCELSQKLLVFQMSKD